MRRFYIPIPLLLAAVTAFAGFGYYSPSTVNTGQVPSTQTDFPILISYTDARFKTVGNGGHVQNSSGFDIRPYSDAALTTAITGYELERYNATTGEVVMWVKRSSLADGNVTYLAYGDATITTDGSSTTTWSTNFDQTFHMKDGTTLSLKNSVTGGTGINSNSVTAAAGQIDGCGGFVSASSQFLSADNSATSSTAITYSAWIKATSFPGAYNCVGGVNNNTNYAILLIKSNGKLACYTNVANYDGTGSHTLSTGTWYHVAMTYNTVAGLVGYVNGASDGTAAAGGSPGIVGLTPDIGKDSVNNRYWNGSIDEFLGASIARTANWLTVEYNEGTPGTFETLGAEVGTTTGNSGFFNFFPR